jgi:hypothetical protein
VLPFTVYYYADGLVGFSGKSHIGVSGGFKMPENVQADFIFYADSSFNDQIKLNFNTKMTISLQAGISWTPNFPWLTRLSLNGIMVAAYAFAHWNNSDDAPSVPN